MITPRERLRRCYFHEELDRPAVYCRTGFPQDDPSYDRLKDYLRQNTDLKYQWHGVSLTPVARVESISEAHSDDFRRQVLVMDTPAGALHSSRLVSLKGQPGLHETFYIKCRGDAERYLSLPLPEPVGEVDDFFAMEQAAGTRGIAETSLGSNPAGHVATLCGSDNLAVMSITDRDVVHALCERQAEILLRRTKYMLSRGIGPFFCMLGEEYIAPPLHGRHDFDDFNVRYDKQIIDLVHEAGGRVHIHCHGKIRTVMQGFLDMGADVLHPFEPPPLGDITAAEAKQFARGKLCLEGNLQIGSMYENTPEQIREETVALIKDAFDDRRGLIVCPTASPYIRGAGEKCFPQFKAMIDAVLG